VCDQGHSDPWAPRPQPEYQAVAACSDHRRCQPVRDALDAYQLCSNHLMLAVAKAPEQPSCFSAERWSDTPEAPAPTDVIAVLVQHNSNPTSRPNAWPHQGAAAPAAAGASPLPGRLPPWPPLCGSGAPGRALTQQTCHAARAAQQTGSKTSVSSHVLVVGIAAAAEAHVSGELSLLYRACGSK
jgi:hypothetical protein